MNIRVWWIMSKQQIYYKVVTSNLE
jgi:hypothetical protein